MVLTDSWYKPIQITVSINEKLITIKVDTGASSSIISYQTFIQIGHIRDQKPSTVGLMSYSGHEIKVLDTVDVELRAYAFLVELAEYVTVRNLRDGFGQI